MSWALMHGLGFAFIFKPGARVALMLLSDVATLLSISLQFVTIMPKRFLLTLGCYFV